MSREGKALVWSLMTGLALGVTICVLFGVVDIQCYGVGRQNWNPTIQACD